MKTLHLYLIRQVLATLAMTVLVFTFVLLLGNGLKAIMPMLISRQAPLTTVAEAALLLIPWVLAFALPIGMLTATLLVFGRFSADQELIAVRASGVSLISLVTPILLLSLVLSVVCGLLNCEIAPRCRVAFNDLLAKAGSLQSNRLLRSGQNVQFRNYSIYVGKIAPDGMHVETVRIWVNDANGDLQTWVHAPKGTITYDPTKQSMSLNLEEPYGAGRGSDGWYPGINSGALTYSIDLRSSSKSDVPISDMTLRQLFRRIKQVESAIRMPPPGRDDPEGYRRHLKEMKENSLTELEVNVHRQIAFSFACVGFTLVGIPLGIRSHRRETSIGMAIALLLLLIYYSFLILANAWTIHPERAPQLIMWLPNFIFQAVGGALLWKANRSG